jgi:hypothetical protein
MKNKLSFQIVFDETTNIEELIPEIDKVPLTDLIHQFEQRMGMETRPVSYGGLIPRYFKFGPVRDHFFATDKAVNWEEEPRRKVALLGCQCGEVGCWPLICQITSDQDTVTWSEFAQLHRPNRDYQDFGPFHFRRGQYEQVVDGLISFWEK